MALFPLEGKEKWAAYRFTKNVNEMWMPAHLDRIRSVIEELPTDFDFDVPQLPNHLSRASTEAESVTLGYGSGSDTLNAGDVTPTSLVVDQQGITVKARKNTENKKNRVPRA
ncbi:hypothetical protein FQN53_005691 [Emmonsiellopsis sp. PD_33]|nr:hypothetical protein FQN53_005691 [Emmonsiellopsis sp. PD_33]